MIWVLLLFQSLSYCLFFNAALHWELAGSAFFSPVQFPFDVSHLQMVRESHLLFYLSFTSETLFALSCTKTKSQSMPLCSSIHCSAIAVQSANPPSNATFFWPSKGHNHFQCLDIEMVQVKKVTFDAGRQ